jgi:hypothetical protein
METQRTKYKILNGCRPITIPLLAQNNTTSREGRLKGVYQMGFESTIPVLE